jgi:hypothetical protein
LLLEVRERQLPGEIAAAFLRGYDDQEATQEAHARDLDDGAGDARKEAGLLAALLPSRALRGPDRANPVELSPRAPRSKRLGVQIGPHLHPHALCASCLHNSLAYATIAVCI